MKYLIMFLSFILLVSCVHKNESTALGENQSPRIVGNDRDPHGCIPSAGYTWSEVRKDCIRVFNDGVRVKDAKCDKTLSTYAVFSPDLSHAEIFAPYSDDHIILTRQGKSGTWTNGKLILSQTNDQWTLISTEKNGHFKNK
jgi:hypothetical protein